MDQNTKFKAGLYLRLSKEDDGSGESVSIGTQRAILTEFCQSHQYEIGKIYIDDGYSGLNFSRPGFLEMLCDIENSLINMVVTKDLSRLGRDYIMTGYYSEIFFPSKGIRYIAIADHFDSAKRENDIAPFKNILNEMYARDISVKIKSAKHQRARQGWFIGSQTPYGYVTAPDNKHQLTVDPETADVVRLIFDLAERGHGNIAIARELKARQIVSPAAYKHLRGDTRFDHFAAIRNDDLCDWSSGTIGQMLNNPVYTGVLVSLKTESINCKTKQRIRNAVEDRIVTSNAHQAIISAEQFARIKHVREGRACPANTSRFNLFRGKLFCECCGHPLTISRKELKDRVTDIYLCMYHYAHPDVCSQTHRVYHDVLYPYVLQQVQSFAKSMRRRKVNSPIKDFADIEELTPEILDATIERIEIGHVKYRSKPGSVIHIYWKLK